MTIVSASEFQFAYGPLEAVIADLCNAPAEAVRVRFRKFRLRDFPDRIQIGSGSRVRYDLPRALAMCAAFALSSGVLSQSDSTEVVAATWPEWCRALVAAAVDMRMIARPSSMPRVASPIISLFPDGFTSPDGGLCVATTGEARPPGASPAPCGLSVDARSILDALLSTEGAIGDFGEALDQLERAFGWSPPVIPMRGKVADMPPRRGFLDDGPYFSRALALLDLSEEEDRRPVRLWKLKLLSDYLQRPVPIDAWKREIGDDEHDLRLHHLLTICADDLGIEMLDKLPGHLAIHRVRPAREMARDMIARAQARRGVNVLHPSVRSG